MLIVHGTQLPRTVVAAQIRNQPAVSRKCHAAIDQ